MKRIVLLFFMMLGIMYCSNDIFADVVVDTTGKWEYNITDNGSVSIHNYLGNDTNITIPSVLDGKNVVAIEDGAFISATLVEQITIPPEIISIEEGAFFGCISLKNFVVSSKNSVYVSSNGILMNKSKTQIICYPANRVGIYTVPKTVKYIAKKAFSYARLSTINISSEVSEIGNYAFMYCVNLREIEIPSNVVVINEGVFACCNSLKKVQISKGVKEIGEYAFLCEKGRSNLEKVYIPQSVESIGEFAFENCHKLVIYGEKSSVAESYAEYKGISFSVESKEETDKKEDPVSGTTTEIGKVTGLCQNTQYSTNSIIMKWNKIKDAQGYEIYRATTQNGKYKRVKQTTSLSYKNSKLKAGKTYYYKVCAYKDINGTRKYGKFSSVVAMETKTNAPSIKVAAGKKQANISWKKVVGANGYEIYMSTSKSGKFKKAKTLTSKTTKFIKKKLTGNKNYYFKIRAYKKASGKKIYSAWSKVRKVKIMN